MSGDSSRVRVTGPLVPYADGFGSHLEAQGYRPNAVADQVRLLAHVSRWLAGQGLDAGDLTSDRVEEFLAARRADGYVLWLSTKGVAPLLGYLRGLGAAPMAAAVPTTPIDDLLAEYRRYLLEERGIARTSAVSYLNVARLFLAEHSDDSGVHLEMLTAAEVVRFVSEQCRLRTPAYIVCGLRSFLRFCHLRELTARPLAGAVPAVASWRLATLPKVLTADHVRSLLASCDRCTTFGQRDFAILTMLVRLGLRAGEVAASELSDIDWHAGEIVIRGKGPRIDRLPLPTDVGEAVASWLQHGRGACACQNVFTRVRAPRLGLTSAGVSAVVSAACRRAGIPEVNAHRLRHTAASEMLRAGSNLTEIGEILRHRTLLATSIYAKVDRSSLSAVAQPWPGGAA